MVAPVRWPDVLVLSSSGRGTSPWRSHGLLSGRIETSRRHGGDRMVIGDTPVGEGEPKGFRTMFAPGRLTLGVFFPIEAYQGDQPTMRDQERLARRAEELGFAALWVRDVPLRDPT